MLKFSIPKAYEKEYMRLLSQVSERVGRLLRRYYRAGGEFDVDGFMRACEKYAVELEPWAVKTAQRFVEKVALHNMASWKAMAGGIALSATAQSAVTMAGRALQAEQVELIKSLPLEAAARAQRLAYESMLGGDRAVVAQQAILNTESVTAARAMLIARTELAKANATLTRARAEAAGVTHYVWRTVKDERVRPAHEDMEGKVCEFASPPYVEGEGYHHAGEFPNCRCYAEPIITLADGSVL